MRDTPPRCPDCSVETESMKLDASGYGLQFVSDENRKGVLGTLGMKQRYDAEAFVCPECGLSRVYADVDED